ncbi:DUF4062 domain-containing protein [Glutamicibacter sp. AOP38-B1-38]|uniref:DUF4062 domain-containing protein n=1 Tax=Glutamicibacter sp. AOP38-B1-38 TaxID=3457680 RepID=UPI00403337DA
MQSLLEMDCIPAGMEMFPAANEDQMTLIKGVIDQCDYYLVVIGGRYGSMSAEGISYTEQEYDYAVAEGIPVMGFVPAEPDAIPRGKTDKSDVAAQKLAAFQEKVQTRVTKDYKNAEDLGGKVARGLSQLRKAHQRPGWVRGDQAMTPETRTEIAELKAEVERLKRVHAEESMPAEVVALDTSFQYGSDSVKLSWIFESGSPYNRKRVNQSSTYTWDDFIKAIGPHMVDEASETQLRNAINKYVAQDVYKKNTKWPTELDPSLELSAATWGIVLTQLRALKIVAVGTKKRSTTDKDTYLRLTKAGDDYLVALHAIKRQQ